MSISSIVAALQAKHALISGVTSAPATYPASLNAVGLPCALTFPGPAVWDEQTVGHMEQKRTFIVRVYVAPIAQGLGVDQGYQACLTLLESFGQAYQSDRSLGGAVEDVFKVEDDGVQVYPFAGADFHGFEFRLSIIE